MSRKEARKSSSIDCDLNIAVEGTQFSAHWSILRGNSVFFKELYKRKNARHCGEGKTQGERRTLDLVHLKGIGAELFEKFLRYVYSGARKRRQLVLKEIKDVLKFSLLFGVRHLISLTRKPCLEDLKVNMDGTGFSDISNLHRALLRFLHDQTTGQRTKNIVTFVAREAYKERSLECLLRILKIVCGSGGSNVEMRLKLLDVLITLFSAGLDVVGRPRVEAGEDGVRCVSSGRRGDDRDVCFGNSRTTRVDLWVPKGKAGVDFPRRQKSRKFYQVKADSKGEAGFSNATSSRDNMEDEGKMVAVGNYRENVGDRRMNSRKGTRKTNHAKQIRLRGRHPDMALKEKLELVGKERQKLTNERVQDTHNCERKKSHDTNKCERKSRDTHKCERKKSYCKEKSHVHANDKNKLEAKTELKSNSLSGLTENTFIEQETRVIRRKVRKRWTREKTAPAILCVQKEVSTPLATSHEQALLTSNTIQPEGEGQSNTPCPNTSCPNTPCPNTPCPNTPCPNTPCPNTPCPNTPCSNTPCPNTPCPNTPCPNVQASTPNVLPNYHEHPERLFLTGGIQKNNYFARRVVFEYDPVNSVYVTSTAMTTSRYNHAIARVGHELYIVGGNSGFFEQLRSVESYSVERTEWSTEASMHEARDEFSLAACDGRLYAIGGYNGIRDLRSVEKLDVGEREAASWSFVSSMGSYRAGACAVTVENR